MRKRPANQSELSLATICRPACLPTPLTALPQDNAAAMLPWTQPAAHRLRLSSMLGSKADSRDTVCPESCVKPMLAWQCSLAVVHGKVQVGGFSPPLLPQRSAGLRAPGTGGSLPPRACLLLTPSRRVSQAGPRSWTLF